MIRKINTNINDLRKPCAEVKVGEDISPIIQDLKDTLEAKKCLGLTANQIGINKRISYIKIPKFTDKSKEIQYTEYILINAKIVEKDRPVKVNNESCVSFPGIPIITKRFVFITVEYFNEKMELQTNMFSDLESLIIQHETDHTLGLTIFDKKWKSTN